MEKSDRRELNRHILVARTAAREMIKEKYGKIVNIGSIYGAVGDIFPAAP
jgi:short-subunit dehydrogenase